MPPTTPATGPGHEQVDRPRDRALRGGDAARRGHQVQLRPHVHRLELLLEPPHVARHLRPDERVQADGREALVLAVLRQHLRGHREERVRELLAHDLGDARLVRGVEEREQEADGDRLDAGLPAAVRTWSRAFSSSSGTSTEPSLQDALGNGQPVAAAHDRVALPRQVLVVREVERLLVPRDVEDVAVALGRDQPDLRAVVLDDDVRRDRRPVEDLVQLRRRRAGAGGQLADPLQRPLGRVLGRGRQLVDEDLAASSST